MLDGRESFEREPEEVNTSKMSWLQELVFGVKDKIMNVFLNGEKLKKKREILAQIGVSGKLKYFQQDEFVEMIESDFISQEEVETAIASCLKLKTLNLYGYLWKPEVFRKRWKVVRLQRFVNDLEEEDKEILWYWISEWILDTEQINLLPFDNHYGLEDFKRDFWSENVIKIFYDKIIQSCTN